MPKELELVIPCEPAKGPDLVRPIYIFLGLDRSGAARCCYECPFCHGRGPRIKPIQKHMGMIANVDPSCPVLRAEYEGRRVREGVL